MRKKRELTQQLIKQLPQDQIFDLDRAMQTWWCNLRESGGYRLTDLGYVIFKQFLQIDHYQHDLSRNPVHNLKILLRLDQRLQAPYYLMRHKGCIVGIAFFSSKEAVLASLYGDIDKFLQNYNDR